MSRVGKGGISSARRKKNFWLTTMLLPGAVWLLLLRYLPMLGITIAFSMRAEMFVTWQTLLIMCLGLVAFVFDSIGGVLFAKFLNLFKRK